MQAARRAQLTIQPTVSRLCGEAPLYLAPDMSQVPSPPCPILLLCHQVSTIVTMGDSPAVNGRLCYGTSLAHIVSDCEQQQRQYPLTPVEHTAGNVEALAVSSWRKCRHGSPASTRDPHISAHGSASGGVWRQRAGYGAPFDHCCAVTVLQDGPCC